MLGGIVRHRGYIATGYRARDSRDEAQRCALLRGVSRVVKNFGRSLHHCLHRLTSGLGGSATAFLSVGATGVGCSSGFRKRAGGAQTVAA